MRSSQVMLAVSSNTGLVLGSRKLGHDVLGVGGALGMAGRMGVRLPSRDEVAAVLADVLPTGGRITRITSQESSGSGLVGVVQRISVEVDGPTGRVSQSFILKTPAEVIAEGPQFAEVEQTFYSSNMAGLAGLGVPRAYMGDGWILLEDLGDHGFTTQAQGYDPDQALAAVREIARLHAYFRRTRVQPWLHPPVDSTVATFCRSRLQGWNRGWPAALKQVPSLLVDRFDEVAVLLHNPDSTVAHGDFHSQNICITRDGCRVIDFQFVQHASGLLDIARLMATSLTTEVRRDIEKSLLDAYHGRLADLGHAPEPDWETSLRAGLLWNFSTPLSLHIHNMSLSGAPWPERLPILERCLIAAEDWEALDLVT